MLSWVLPLVALVILPVVLRLFAEDGPDNAEHDDADRDEPGGMAEAA